jgi:hypothetical protein
MQVEDRNHSNFVTRHTTHTHTHIHTKTHAAKTHILKKKSRIIFIHNYVMISQQGIEGYHRQLSFDT